MKSSLNQPFTLPCGSILPNRIAKAAMTERMAGTTHWPDEGHFRLYEHWAKGGAGILLTGNIIVDKRYLESTGNIVIERDTPIEPFKVWTARLKNYDGQFWAQISHAGRQSSIFSTRKPVSASDVQLKKMGLFAKPRPLTDSEVKDVIDRFVYAAGFCLRAGFDGVQFHAAHGYLISQFLSPKTNLRTDQWGGNIEKRARILFEIVEKSRASVGKDFAISVKLNSADFQRGGFDEEDARFVIKELENRGVDLLEISGGTYEKSAMMGVGMKESTRSREAYFLDFAKGIRKDSQVPLMVTGGFRTRAVCEEALENDELDVIGMARPFLMHDDFPIGFLNDTLDKVTEPVIKILDKNNADAAEAGYYDLLIKRLANGKALRHDYGALRAALHIPKNEFTQGIRNWLLG